VLAHARFVSPGDIVSMMMKEYCVTTDVRQVHGYNPTKTCFEAGDKWREVFNAARKAYLEEVAHVPISSQAFRLNELMDNYTRAKAKGNLPLANQILEQAAKEVGGVLTNDRNLKIDRSNSSPLSELTPEERRAMVADMLSQALDKHKLQNAATTETPQ
jgi:hypothetical protein